MKPKLNLFKEKIANDDIYEIEKNINQTISSTFGRN
jgi:hypothetical protein